MRSLLTTAGVLALMLSIGCSTRPPATHATSDQVVDPSNGYMRLRGVEPADIRPVVAQLAESKQWTRVSNKESGSYAPASKDDFTRGIDVFRDPQGSDIRIEWVWEKGRDCYVAEMRSPPTREQWQYLHSGAGRAHVYFRRMLQRLEMRGFYQIDPIHQVVARAMNAAGTVAIHMGYMTIQCRVGGANELGPEADPQLWLGEGI